MARLTSGAGTVVRARRTAPGAAGLPGSTSLYQPLSCSRFSTASTLPVPPHGQVEHAFATERPDQLVVKEHGADVLAVAPDIGFAALQDLPHPGASR